MRKLTGYIGAMIIVFALMGSVLLGFALNINGQSTVINDYEKITDVSGLYTHSEEKTYIDYNPASNYIGYSQLIENDAPYYIPYKYWNSNHTFRYYYGNVTIDGVSYGTINHGNAPGNFIFLSNKIFIYEGANRVYCNLHVESDSANVYSADFTISKSGNNVTV